MWAPPEPHVFLASNGGGDRGRDCAVRVRALQAATLPLSPLLLLQVGSGNRKVMQYDTRTGSCVLEYNYHLGAVRCVGFC